MASLTFGSSGFQKRVFFIRHGQSLANASGILDEDIDPTLSENGLQQAEECRDHFAANFPEPDIVISSTLERALLTASIVFSSNLERGAKIVAMDICRGRVGHKSSSRGLISEKTFKYPKFDFTGLFDEDPYIDAAASFSFQKHLPLNEQFESIGESMERAYKFMDILAALPEKNIAVISHSGFIASFMAVAYGINKYNVHKLIDWPKNCCIVTALLIDDDKEEGLAKESPIAFIHARPRWWINVQEKLKAV